MRLRIRLAALLLVVLLSLPAFSPADSSLAGQSERKADFPSAAGQPASTDESSVEASNKESSEKETAEELHTTLSMVLTAREHLMLDLIDQQRNQVGLGHLELDDTMIELARFRSQDMASQNYFSHVAPDGSSARDLMVDARIGPGLMGEILGRNNSADSVESVHFVVDAFMKSPDHRDAIVNDRFVTVGVGAATGSDGMSYYAVLFFGP